MKKFILWGILILMMLLTTACGEVVPGSTFQECQLLNGNGKCCEITEKEVGKLAKCDDEGQHLGYVQETDVGIWCSADAPVGYVKLIIEDDPSKVANFRQNELSCRELTAEVLPTSTATSTIKPVSTQSARQGQPIQSADPVEPTEPVGFESASFQEIGSMSFGDIHPLIILLVIIAVIWIAKVAGPALVGSFLLIGGLILVFANFDQNLASTVDKGIFFFVFVALAFLGIALGKEGHP